VTASKKPGALPLPGSTQIDFIDARAFAAKLAPDPHQDPLSKFLYENLTTPTQQLVCAKEDGPLLRRQLARELNQLLGRELLTKQRRASLLRQKDAMEPIFAAGRGTSRLLQKANQLEQQLTALASIGPLYEPDRFRDVVLTDYLLDFIRQDPQSHSRIRLNRLLLEAAYPNEIVRSLGGVYPDREIYTPSLDDQQACFQQYTQDVYRRQQLNQLRPGEEVKIIDNRVQVSGQPAVMGINALLTKVIFDKNPSWIFLSKRACPSIGCSRI
jgi:hypothetical protein